MAPDKKFDAKSKSIFSLNVIAINSARDSWVVNFSESKLRDNMKKMIDVYNQEVKKIMSLDKSSLHDVDSIIESDLSKIKWSVNLKNDLLKGKIHTYEDSNSNCLYRPFSKSLMYFDRNFIERPGLSSNLFPYSGTNNKVICVTGVGASKEFSIIITDILSTLDNIEKSQLFPLYFFEKNNKSQKDIFEDSNSNEDYIKRDGITDYIFELSQKQYGANNISKEDIFYYVYGILHSPEYKETFSNDLKKMLPRIPLVDDVREFWSFSKSGRELAELHLNYEKVSRYDGVKVVGEDSGFFKVEKMRFPKKDQKDTIIFNSKISIQNIPSESYDYVVNGKSAIEWVMERYQITTHKESQITNDPNEWSEEVGNPRYILDLILAVINVSVQTVEIVKNLPKLKFD